LNALGRLLGVEVAYRRRQRSIAEVDGRPLDDGSGAVDDEAKTSALVEECQPIPPRILIHAALAQAGDLSPSFWAASIANSIASARLW
jgi:hypothetical protein